MNNELYLGPSVDVAQSNQLGSAALNILHGAPALGHEKKINVADYGALLVAYIILNDETVGLFVYDEDDGAYVHHQFMSSRVERCLLAHAAEISAPFLQTQLRTETPPSKTPPSKTPPSEASPTETTSSETISSEKQSVERSEKRSVKPPTTDALTNLNDFLTPAQASPEVLLPSALTHLTASQRLHRKIRAIRKSDTPVYAVKSNLSESVVITRLASNQHVERDRELIQRSPGFIAWLSDKSDDELAHIVDGCRMSDRPKHFKVLFETPARLSLKALRILDTFDAASVELVSIYADRFEITNAEAKARVSQPTVKHIIDRGLIHQLELTDIALDIHNHVHSR